MTGPQSKWLMGALCPGPSVVLAISLWQGSPNSTAHPCTSSCQKSETTRNYTSKSRALSTHRVGFLALQHRPSNPPSLPVSLHTLRVLPQETLVPVALVVVLACRRLTAAMPSLYPDRSAQPPVLPERIMLMIQEPVRRLNQPLPVWYSDVEASVGKLIRLGAQTSLYPDAVETKHKLQAISEAISPIGAAGCVVDRYLGRGTRDEIARRCDCFSLSLALGLIDSWLRSCEDYMRRNSNMRIKDDLTQLSQLNRELSDISRRHGIRDYSHDSVFHLFDSLGLLGADRPRHSKSGFMHIWFVRIADYWHRRTGKWRRRRGQDLEPGAIQKGYEQ